MKNVIIKTAALNALLTAAYIILVALFLSSTSKIFGPDEPKSLLIPAAMLSLLVFSVALVGSLIFGRPVLWYLDGKKQEAVYLLAYTLGIFFVITILAFVVLFFSF